MAGFTGSRFSGTINGQRIEIEGDRVRVNGFLYEPAEVTPVGTPAFLRNSDGSYRAPPVDPPDPTTRRLMAHQMAVAGVAATYVRTGIATAVCALLVAMFCLPAPAGQAPPWGLVPMFLGWVYLAWDSNRDKNKAVEQAERIERGE